VYRVVIKGGRWEVIKGSSYPLLDWGIREVTQDCIEFSSFLIYSIKIITFTVATGNSTLTMTLTQLDLM